MDRDGECWAFSRTVHFDSRGKLLANPKTGEHLIFARSFHACKKSGWDSDDSIPKGRNKVIKVPCLNLLVMISFGHSDFTRNYGKFPCGRSGHFYKTKFHKYPIKTIM